MVAATSLCACLLSRREKPKTVGGREETRRVASRQSQVHVFSIVSSSGPFSPPHFARPRPGTSVAERNGTGGGVARERGEERGRESVGKGGGATHLSPTANTRVPSKACDRTICCDCDIPSALRSVREEGGREAFDRAPSQPSLLSHDRNTRQLLFCCSAVCLSKISQEISRARNRALKPKKRREFECARAGEDPWRPAVIGGTSAKGSRE